MERAKKRERGKRREGDTAGETERWGEKGKERTRRKEGTEKNGHRMKCPTIAKICASGCPLHTLNVWFDSI